MTSVFPPLSPKLAILYLLTPNQAKIDCYGKFVTLRSPNEFIVKFSGDVTILSAKKLITRGWDAYWHVF